MSRRLVCTILFPLLVELAASTCGETPDPLIPDPHQLRTLGPPWPFESGRRLGLEGFQVRNILLTKGYWVLLSR